jgi:Sec-independent protein translocase protein TatA
MSNPVIHAFFVGRAIAQVLNNHLEDSLTHAMSELGKFDAEQRERLRQFTQEVLERAQQEEEAATGLQSPSNPAANSPKRDLQATIDELRAEIARLRSALQNHRNQTIS